MNKIFGASVKYEVKKIREEAKKNIENGAITSDYVLNPKKSFEILNEALASEILCVLRYRSHQFRAKGIHAPQLVAEFKEHAKNEEKHVLMIAERINQLGGIPEMNPSKVAELAATEYGNATTLVEMIKANLVAERIAITLYRKMVEWFGNDDPTSRRMIEKILEDEEEHASELADLLVEEKKSFKDMEKNKVA